MTISYSLLAQARLNTTSATSIYQPGISQTVQLFIKVVNVSSNAARITFYHDQSGTTYDETTAITSNMKILPNEFLELDHIFMDNPSGNLAYKTNLANAFNVTVYGVVRV